jgi:hypothetical protein
MSLDDERGANDRRIGTVCVLPDVMTQHHYRGGGGGIVRGGDHASAKCLNPERRKIVAVDVLRAQRSCRRFHVLSSYAEARPSGLKRGDLFKLGQVGFQPFEQRKREHAPSILRSALHAAVAAVTDPIQP